MEGAKSSSSRLIMGYKATSLHETPSVTFCCQLVDDPLLFVSIGHNLLDILSNIIRILE
jgi:hypothetical protein